MEIFTNKLEKKSGENAITSMSGAVNCQVGPPAEYGGSEQTLNPEEMLVASVNSCLMLVFYHFVKKMNLPVISYKSKADGKVEKTKNGLRFTAIKVEATVETNDINTSQQIQEAADMAEKFCLVSNSLAFDVEYSVQVNEN